jgi:ATP-dependent helicase/nuclease subunit A
LLHWLERGRESGARGSGLSDLLLAPISAQGEDKNPMAAYLRRLEKVKGHFEDGRLLYVATTRAKQRLHLLGHVGFQEREGGLELKDPPKDSLLVHLWPVVENNFQSLLAEQDIETLLLENTIESAVHTSVRTRLAQGWSLPTPPKSIRIADTRAESVTGELIEFGWAGETARHVGTVVHRLLQHIGTIGIDHVESGALRRFEHISRKMLVRLGVPEGRIKVALEEIAAILKATSEDERGQWILSDLHENASCELALSGKRDGGVEHTVIDRTFVDKLGTRWIIDYKTGAHIGGGVDEFLDREQERYREQLERYASIMSKMEERLIRLGLYFPLLGGWREWSFLTQ